MIVGKLNALFGKGVKGKITEVGMSYHFMVMENIKQKEEIIIMYKFLSIVMAISTLGYIWFATWAVHRYELMAYGAWYSFPVFITSIMVFLALACATVAISLAAWE